MKCCICGKEILLYPSAEERARKLGGKPIDYTKLFPAHPQCVIRKREEDTLELLRRNQDGT